MKRGAQGAIWALPLAYALSQGIGASISYILTCAGLFAALGFVGARRVRIPLRAALYLGSLAIVLHEDPRKAPQLLHRVLTLVWHLRLTALTPQESTLLYLALVPLLFLFFELGGSVQWRIFQGIFAVAVLAVLQRLDVAVTGEALLLCALFFPVRYYDLAAERGGEAPTAFAAALLFAAAAYGLLTSNAPILPHISTGGSGQRLAQGYLANPQEIDVSAQRSGARYFFAAVRQPVYWATYVGERYTGQGWLVGGRWRAMQPLQLVGGVPSGETVHAERLVLYRSLPTDPVGGALLTVLSPYATWRYRAASASYSAPGSRITVLVALPQPGRGLSGGGAPPPTAEDLAVPAGVDSSAVRQIASLAVQGAPPTTMGKAQAIIAYLQANERYTLNVPSDQHRDFVYDFLLVHHAGDCNGFSSAFAILARMDGIPTRWVSGFLPGQRVRGGYLITAADAHSWDEIYVQGAGWVQIDPTPGFSVPQSPPVTSTQSASVQAASALANARLAERQLAGSVPNGPGPGAAGPGLPAWAVVAVLLAALSSLGAAGRATLPNWWLRGIAFAFRDPWRRRDTVRHWLRGRAPALQAYVEWRTYRPQGTCPVTLRAARRDLGRLYLHRP